MHNLKWLVSLQLKLLKNRYFIDQKTQSRTVIGVGLMVAFIYSLTRILYSRFPFELSAETMYYQEIVFLMFVIVMIWLFLMAFIQGLSTYVKTYYKSSEMNHLMTLPIDRGQLFLLSFFKHVLYSNKTMLIIIIPFVSVIGLMIDASTLFFVLILPLYFVLALVPTALSTLVALVSLKYVSSKKFSFIVTGASLLLNVVFALSFTRFEALFNRLLPRISNVLDRPLMMDVFPITSGARLLMTVAGVDSYYFSVFFYLAMACLLSTLSYVLSKKLYFKGWEQSQVVSEKKRRKTNLISKEKNLTTLRVIFKWMKAEWTMAIRNYDMFIASFSMLSFYTLGVLAVSFTQFLSSDSFSALAFLILLATLLNVMAVSVLFLPADLSKDKALWKQRYWLVKIMPFKSVHVLMIQVLTFFIPAYGFSVLGLVVFSLSASISMPIFAIASIVLALVLFGATLVYVTTEMLALNPFFEKNSLLGNSMTFLLPILYALASVGLITLFITKEYLISIETLYRVAQTLNIELISTVSLVTVFGSFLFAYSMFRRVWSHLEF